MDEEGEAVKKIGEDAFCPTCEWTGDAKGITSCPVCGSNLSSLDSFNEVDEFGSGKDRYPAEFLTKIHEMDDEYIE